MNLRTVRQCAMVAAMLSVTANSPGGTVIFTENFDYPAGALNGQNGGSGFSGAWTAQMTNCGVVNASLTYPMPGGGIINGGTKALLLTNNFDMVATRVPTRPVSGTNVYLSFLIQLQSGSIEDNDFATIWFNTTAGPGAGLKGNGGDGSKTADFMARPRSDNTTGAYQQNIVAGQTYFVVAKFSKTGVFSGMFDRVTLWVNPSIDPVASSNVSFTALGNPDLIGTITNIGFRTVNLDAPDKVLFDAVACADNWQDVISAFSSARTTNTITSSLNPASPGSNITFTATINVVPPGNGTPTGNVVFKDGTTILGTNTLNVSAVAVFSTTSLLHGAHTIIAEYQGDQNFFGSTNSLSANQVIDTGPVIAAQNLQHYPACGVKVRAATLLANATDAENDALTLSSVSSISASNGTIAVTNGWVCYSPPAGFTNSDSFSYVVADSSGLQGTGTVFIAMAVDPDSAKNVSSVEQVGGNSLRIHFSGIPARTYRIQYAENLQTPNWQSLGTARADAIGKFDFTNSPAFNSPPRSYRSTFP